MGIVREAENNLENSLSLKSIRIFELKCYLGRLHIGHKQRKLFHIVIAFDLRQNEVQQYENGDLQGAFHF